MLYRSIHFGWTSSALCWPFAGITGILMSAAGLPVCLTRPPKLVLHPPPVSKSDIKPVPGLGHCCRKTTKKQARKGGFDDDLITIICVFTFIVMNRLSCSVFPLLKARLLRRW